jgi:hypothetical protein
MFVDTIVDYNRFFAEEQSPPNPIILTHFYWVRRFSRITEHSSLVIIFILLL